MSGTPPKKTYIIPFAHDAFFKRSLQEIGIARDFFKHHLPKAVLKALDLNTLCLQSNSFIEKDGGYRFSDIIYQIRILEKSGYLFCLLEHQSTPDRWMALRMQTYLMHFLNKQVRQGVKKLPPFFLMVFYHGKRSPYPYSQDFFDLFENPAWAKEQFLQPFHLVDIQQESDEAILQHDDAATLEMLQKHIYDSDIGIAVRKLKESGCLKNIAIKYGDLTKFVVKYMLVKGDSPNKSRVVEDLCDTLSEHRGEIMTIAQQIHQEGIDLGMERGMERGMLQGVKKGREEGIEEGRKKTIKYITMHLLKQGRSINIISQLTGISVKSLSELTKEKQN